MIVDVIVILLGVLFLYFMKNKKYRDKTFEINIMTVSSFICLTFLFLTVREWSIGQIICLYIGIVVTLVLYKLITKNRR